MACARGSAPRALAKSAAPPSGLALVGSLPTAVGLGALYRGQARRLHPAFLGQRATWSTLRWTTRYGAPRREALTEGQLVQAPHLPVDPAMAKRLVKRLRRAEPRRLLGALLGQAQPDASRMLVMLA